MIPILFFGIIFFDQVVKFFIENTMEPGESIPVLDSIFHITYILNPGAAFGIMENARLFFILAGLLIVGLFFFFRRRLERGPSLFYLGSVLLIAGTVGNLIDRLRMGLVVDYLDFRIWPVFNIADISIVVGVALMIWSMLTCKDKEVI